MARIRIYIARHLCTAPRPQKEAAALAAAGHDVSIHGVSYDARFAPRDAALAAGQAWRWEPAADFSGSRPLRWLACRVRHRLAKAWYARTGQVSADVWSFANRELARHAHHQPADLTIVHSEGGLWFGHRLAGTGARVGVDFEDWFSRDLTAAQRRGRPVTELAELEIALLRDCRYRLTTSRCLAEALGAAAGTEPPAVIYNTFPAGPSPARPVPREALHLHWFSLVLGPARGLETLMAALPKLRGDWQLCLRGDEQPGYRSHLLSLLPAVLHPRIHFAPTVPAAELPARLAEHDVGLALDVSTITSRNLTITNKLFHYLQAGLAVAASATAGHQEALALAPGAGALFAPDDSTALAGVLNRWLSDRSAVQSARLAARQAFEQQFAHERQQPRYAELAGQALDN